jgi:hypothetical protein
MPGSWNKLLALGLIAILCLFNAETAWSSEQSSSEPKPKARLEDLKKKQAPLQAACEECTVGNARGFQAKDCREKCTQAQKTSDEIKKLEKSKTTSESNK